MGRSPGNPLGTLFFFCRRKASAWKGGCLRTGATEEAGRDEGLHSYFGDMVRAERLLREHGFDHWPTDDELVRYLFATNDRLDAVCNAMNAELVQDIRGNWQVVPKSRVMG